jgi:hypothetical protein
MTNDGNISVFTQEHVDYVANELRGLLPTNCEVSIELWQTEDDPTIYLSVRCLYGNREYGYQRAFCIPELERSALPPEFFLDTFVSHAWKQIKYAIDNEE